MPKNISPGTGVAFELRATALSDTIEYALSKQVDRAELNEPGSRFLGELHACRGMLHELMGCTLYEVGTLQAHESIRRSEEDSWISCLRKLQESCKVYMDAASNGEAAASRSAATCLNLTHLADSLVELIFVEGFAHAAPTGQHSIS